MLIVGASFGWAKTRSKITDITLDPDRSNFIGVLDLAFMVPPELQDMKNADKQVYLIGDAGAFLYQIPMSRLHYRSVFDVPADATDAISAWAGESAKHDHNSLLVINPTEVARLHRTYKNIPPPLPEWKDKDEPFVLRGEYHEWRCSFVMACAARFRTYNIGP